MRNNLFLVLFILLSLGLIGCDSSNNAEVEKSVSWLNLHYITEMREACRRISTLLIDSLQCS